MKDLTLIGHILYFGGIFLGGATVAFILFCLGYTDYIPHTIIGGLLITMWTAVIAMIRQALRKN